MLVGSPARWRLMNVNKQDRIPNSAPYIELNLLDMSSKFGLICLHLFCLDR